MLRIFKTGLNLGIKLNARYGLERFPLINWVYRFFKRHRKNNREIQVLGHKMLLDTYDAMNLSINGVYEEFETKFFEREIKEGNVIIDIGANIGYYTLIFAKAVGTAGKIFSFEPDIENFFLLKKNIEVNCYQNVVIEQKAVSNQTGDARLYLSRNSAMDHSLCASCIMYRHSDDKQIIVSTIKLDDYFQDYDGKIDFIKMDIEGAEGLAFNGMRQIIEKNPNIGIVTEFHPYYLEAFGTKPKDYLNTIRGFGFKIYNINETKKCIQPINNDEELLKIYTSQRRNYTNLFCVKKYKIFA